MSPIRALVIGVTPFSHGGGSAMRGLQHLDALRRRGSVAAMTIAENAATFPFEGSPPTEFDAIDAARGRSPAGRRLWWAMPESLPFTAGFDWRWIAARVEDSLRRHRPDLVVLQSPWLWRFAPMIRRHAGRLVYDAHNIEAAYRAEVAADERRLTRRWRLRLVARRAAAVEGRLLGDVDEVWVCSADDARRLAIHGRTPATRIIPNAIDLRRFDALAVSPARKPPTLLFAGAFGYLPNARAAERLIDDILPTIRARIGRVRLLLVGASPTARMLDAARGDADVVVTGFVPDVRPHLQSADIAVVPLQEGGGTRFKLLEAFAARIPVISTRKGAEGLDVSDGRDLLIREAPPDIAAAVQTLLSDRALAETITQSARHLVEARYAWESVAPLYDG